MEQEKTILDYETVDFDLNKKELLIIDQTKLPGEICIIGLKTAKDIWDAIYLLKVRGAPAIGVAAAFGLYILGEKLAGEADSYESFLEKLAGERDYLDSSRPTAVNLHWALTRMYSLAENNVIHLKNTGIPVALGLNIVLSAMEQEAIAIKKEDIEVCRRIGEYGLTLLKEDYGVLTHCNAGQLATVKYGTATAPIYLAHQRGMKLRVYADETRPLLQGARLTAFELMSAGVDVTLLCDNMCASLMKEGKIDAVLVGCDRVAANGDTANKIGTSGVAVIAAHYGIPVYICAPTSTIDMSIPSGDRIVIEQRGGEEVTSLWYEKPMAPKGVKVYNPAFDVTDHRLIAGIITEYGIAGAPYEESLKRIFELKKQEAD